MFGVWSSGFGMAVSPSLREGVVRAEGGVTLNGSCAVDREPRASRS